MENNLNDTLQKFWQLDAIGMDGNTENNKSLDDYRTTVDLKDGKFVAALPWKTNHPPLPTNYNLAASCAYRRSTLSNVVLH